MVERRSWAETKMRCKRCIGSGLREASSWLGTSVKISRVKLQVRVLCVFAALLAAMPTGSARAHGKPTLADERGVSACEPESAAATVQVFADTFNAGDTIELDRLVAGTATFLWYSTDEPGQRFDPEARDRSNLMSYFAERHTNGERLELTSFQFNGNWGGYGNFEFDAIRSANDALAPTPYQGKGALDCATSPHTVVLWSMASTLSPTKP
jgi:hypothetical protein